jgi:RHS repeat-associated protein
VTDQNARVHEHVEYFPYGEVWRDPRSDVNASPVKGQRFLFTGKELDEETGLYYFGARYYDPIRVRWISVDPIGDTFGRLNKKPERTFELSVYSYAAQNPVVLTDTNGRCVELASGEVDCVGAFVDVQARALVGTVESWRNGEYGYSVTNALLGVLSLGGYAIALPMQLLYEPGNYVVRYRNALAEGDGRAIQDIHFELLVAAETAGMGSLEGRMAAALAGPAATQAENVMRRLAPRAPVAWSKIAGMLQGAARGKGNFGIGSATLRETEVLGQAWVGEGATLSSDGTAWVSKDGLRQYRPPSYKPRMTKVQANLESRAMRGGGWQSNAHVDVEGF